jgi:hypothetical protein
MGAMINIRTFLFYVVATMLFAFAPAQARECQLKMVGTMDAVVGNNGRLLVPVTVEGQKGYFRFELGAPISAILASSADGVNLKRSKIRTGLEIHLDDQEMTEQVAPTLGLDRTSGPVVLGVLPSLYRPDPREIGVLGFDILRNFDVELDLAHNKINLFSPDHCPGQVIYWTHTAPVAVLQIRTPGLVDFSVTMQLDGKDLQTKIMTSADHARLSTRIAEKEFGIAPPDVDALKTEPKPYTFKALTVDGLTITNPVIYPYLDNALGGCNGQSHEDETPLHNETHRLMMHCFGRPDLYIGLAEISKLRVFFDFSEKMLYATAADAK